MGRRYTVNGIQEAQSRWHTIRNKARRNGVVGAVVAIAVLVAIIALAGSLALAIIAGIVAVVGVGLYVVAIMGKRVTGLSINPEWKPLNTGDDFEDIDGDDSSDASDAPAVSEPSYDDEPIRRLDAQILGEDLTKLGQVVSPKLSKSYALGDLELKDGVVRWVPSVASARQGIELLEVEPTQVTSVERAPLWGSWALLRIATAEGAEWCMRIPNSVDLSPAFHEVGLTLQSS